MYDQVPKKEEKAYFSHFKLSIIFPVIKQASGSDLEK
jgi:hypothetical protein